MNMIDKLNINKFSENLVKTAYNKIDIVSNEEIAEEQTNKLLKSHNEEKAHLKNLIKETMQQNEYLKELNNKKDQELIENKIALKKSYKINITILILAICSLLSSIIIGIIK